MNDARQDFQQDGAMAAEGDQSITTTTVVVANPRQVSVETGEETLILHLDTGSYHSLRNVAARIWDLLQNPIAVSDVAEVLSREYVTPREQCEADLLELLPALAERGLLKIVSEAEG
ncbi:MAG TPA: PqqD family protein [Gemmatimonadota bacterium]|nr:PqqD family protein [Gemmatimonadota bacterium]